MKRYIKSSMYNSSSAVNRFLEELQTTNIVDMDISILKEACDEMFSEYDSLPEETWDNLDELPILRGAFYGKYIEFASTCRDILKGYNLGSGYHVNSNKLYKIYSMLKTVDYNFPYGWKRLYNVYRDDINHLTI